MSTAYASNAASALPDPNERHSGRPALLVDPHRHETLQPLADPHATTHLRPQQHHHHHHHHHHSHNHNHNPDLVDAAGLVVGMPPPGTDGGGGGGGLPGGGGGGPGISGLLVGSEEEAAAAAAGDMVDDGPPPAYPPGMLHNDYDDGVDDGPVDENGDPIDDGELPPGEQIGGPDDGGGGGGDIGGGVGGPPGAGGGHDEDVENKGSRSYYSSVSSDDDSPRENRVLTFADERGEDLCQYTWYDGDPEEIEEDVPQPPAKCSDKCIIL